MKKILLFIVAAPLCAASYAEWKEPIAPSAQSFATGQEFYLFNVEARAFLVGANEWGTRASVSPSSGHKVIIEQGTLSNSYYITNYVLQGKMANQWGYAFIDESRNIWVDDTKTGETENQFTFKHLGDNKYRICLSDANTFFKYTDSEDTYLGVGKNGEDTRLYLCDLTDHNQYPEAECKLIYYENWNGGAFSEQIAKEYEYLNTMYSAATAGIMKDGDDCTELLVNPDFKVNGGWNSAAGIEWPLGKDDFKLFQAWGRVCDVSQTLNDLQNGIYEMTLQAVYKPDNDEAIRETYAYINDFDTKIGVPTEEHPVNSADEASDAFKEGHYTVTAYGLVTDNTMRLGIANRLRTGENGVLWAGGVKLTYRAKNAEACSSLCTYLAQLADNVITGDLGQDEIKNLSEAITNADGVSGDAGYNALVELKAALDEANKGIELYKSLTVAIDGLKEAIEKNGADKITVNKATELYNTAKAAYEAKSYNNEAAEEAISEIKAITVSLKMGGVQTSEDNPADYTSAIVNNNFDPEMGNKDEIRIDGWEVEGALNGYESNTCSFNKGTFKLSQKLEGLPKGNYKVTVHTFYRAGSYEEEEVNVNAGRDTHLMKIFANTAVDNYEGNIMNLSEGSNDVTLPDGISTKTINGITVPDGIGASAKCFDEGLFLHELEFTVGDDGIVTIGLKLEETIGTDDYTVVGKWNLYYYGDDDNTINVTGIDELEAGTPIAYFTLSGKRIAAPQEGINIIKMSDGSVVKMMICK